MKILICDFSENKSEYQYEKHILESELPGCDVEHYNYTNDRDEYLQKLKDTDYLLTSFVPLDFVLMTEAAQLKAVSVTATEYGTIDCEGAAKLGISVYHVNDYCSEEVAIHTVAMVLSLLRAIKQQDLHVQQDKKWDLQAARGATVPSETNAVIYGYGKIGKKTAGYLKALGMKVSVVSAHADEQELRAQGYEKIDEAQVGKIADVICNHQNATGLSVHYFDDLWFLSLERKPVFVNAGRGINVDETALAKALDIGQIRGAGLDVLESENPNLEQNPLLGRRNVMITPHSAFYSERSMKALLWEACMNLVHHIRKDNLAVDNCVVKGVK